MKSIEQEAIRQVVAVAAAFVASGTEARGRYLGGHSEVRCFICAPLALPHEKQTTPIETDLSLERKGNQRTGPFVEMSTLALIFVAFFAPGTQTPNLNKRKQIQA
jgi:hypothetical protein